MLLAYRDAFVRGLDAATSVLARNRETARRGAGFGGAQRLGTRNPEGTVVPQGRPAATCPRCSCQPLTRVFRAGVRKGIVPRTPQTLRTKPLGTKRNSVSHSWYDKPIIEGWLNVTNLPMTTTLIGYARCSTDKQDLAAQKAALMRARRRRRPHLTDHGLTGTNRSRPGLDQALAAVRTGDTLCDCPSSIGWRARSRTPDPSPTLSLYPASGSRWGRAFMTRSIRSGKMFFNILATFADYAEPAVMRFDLAVV